MKYYMFSAGSTGASFDENIPDGAVEISEFIYKNPDGYDVKDNELIPPSEEVINSIKQQAVSIENRDYASKRYEAITSEINAIKEKLFDDDYETPDQKSKENDRLDELKKSRIKIRSYLSLGDFINPVNEKD